MEGSVLTAWFHAQPSALAALVHPDFVPNVVGRQARLRFYQVKAEANGEEVEFSEAVLAFKTTYRGTPGELSVCMWTDSLPYLAWGREVFGWPLTLADVQLTSGIWDGNLGVPADSRIGDLSLTAVRVNKETAPVVGESPTWITPHRKVDATDPQAEARVVYAVRPRLIARGTVFSCTGELDVSSVLGDVADVVIDFVAGAKIVVGENVSRIG